MVARMLPHVKTLVLFQDDLPADPQARLKKVDALSKQAWSKPLDHWPELSQTLSANFSKLGNNSYKGEERRTDRTTRSTVKTTTVIVPASQALILLPERSFTPQRMLASLCSQPALCAAPQGVNPHRIILWHEIGHLETSSMKGMAYTARLDEKLADMSSNQHCLNMGDKVSAQFMRDWRVLSNFFSPIEPADAQYWNDLPLAGIPCTPEREDGAQIEVKSRACGLRITPRKKLEDVVYQAFNPQRATPLTIGYGPKGLSAATKLQLLSHQLNTPYRFDESRRLARLVVSAARRLMPGAGL